MGWLADYLENRRLTAEKKKLGDRVAFLEKERERLTLENRERDLAWADRFLTSKGQYAIADEAKAKADVLLPEAQRLRDIKTAEELQAHMDAQLARLKEDARDAGFSETEALAKFTENKARYEQEFYDTQGSFF